MSNQGQGFLSHFNHVLYVLFCAYTRPRYQVSVYRTIGPPVATLGHICTEMYSSFVSKIIYGTYLK